ncbi:MAG: GtrA family protein [Lysobacterales bacterium]
MRKPLLFLAVGGVQYVLDAGLYAALVSGGVATLPANIGSRASAAGLGFLLNRYLTFGQRNETLERFSRSLLRFLLLFAVLTLLSSLALLGLEEAWGADPTRRIAAKLLVEAVLAGVSFLASRFWVYRS